MNGPCHIGRGGICFQIPFETIRTVHVILGVVEYVFRDHLKQYELFEKKNECARLHGKVLFYIDL